MPIRRRTSSPPLPSRAARERCTATAASAAAAARAKCAKNSSAPAPSPRRPERQTAARSPRRAAASSPPLPLEPAHTGHNTAPVTLGVRDAQPVDLHLEQATKFELVINRGRQGRY